MFEPEISKWIPEASVNEAGDVVISGFKKDEVSDIRGFVKRLNDSLFKSYTALSDEDRPKSFKIMKSEGLRSDGNNEVIGGTITYVAAFDTVHAKVELAKEG